MTVASDPSRDASALENRPFDDIDIGDDASISHTVSQHDLELSERICGDTSPAYPGGANDAAAPAHGRVAHGMLETGLIAHLLGTQLPGPGAIYLAQELHFEHPAGLGDTVTAHVTVIEKHPQCTELTLACRCLNQHGQALVTGTARVRASREKIRWTRGHRQEARPHRQQRFRTLLERSTEHPPMVTAIIHAGHAQVLLAAADARAAGLIEPLLIGPRVAIERAAADSGVDIGGLTVIDTEHARASVAAALRLARDGMVQMLVSGALPVDELLPALLSAEAFVPNEHRLSHVHLLDVPRYPRPLLLSDAVVNATPDLAAKSEIVQNAVDLAHALGMAWPRVAVLSAMETVTPKLSSTLDAAVLCKMAERGQIQGAILDGPLSFDHAVSPHAAAEQGLISPVAGQADILLVPNMEAGHALVHQLMLLADADSSGLILGAPTPLVLGGQRGAGFMYRVGCAAAAQWVRNNNIGDDIG